MKTKSVIMCEMDIKRTLKRMALEIIEKNDGPENIILVGIKSRGVPMAARFAGIIKEIEEIEIPVGVLNISLYRDDLLQIAENPVLNEANLGFEVEGKKIILVDDVLYTGKTVKTAMDTLYEVGLPKSIQLAVLIDRGHHLMPIRADIVGRKVPTAAAEIIKVSFTETDAEENVKVMVK